MSQQSVIDALVKLGATGPKHAATSRQIKQAVPGRDLSHSLYVMRCRGEIQADRRAGIYHYWLVQS
jgi:hypothetical protein